MQPQWCILERGTTGALCACKQSKLWFLKCTLQKTLKRHKHNNPKQGKDTSTTGLFRLFVTVLPWLPRRWRLSLCCLNQAVMSSPKEETLSPDELRKRLYQTFKNRGVLDTLKVSWSNRAVVWLLPPQSLCFLYLLILPAVSDSAAESAHPRAETALRDRSRARDHSRGCEVRNPLVGL